jgi:molybdopterin converting factor small subunit
MDVTVRVFAAFADVLGTSERIISVAEPATVGALRSAVAALSPALPPRPLIAVNLQYADDDLVLRPTDEIAVIPPVAGG